jgi:predicted RNase H-like nuclease (RuvC/YqgF family)
MSFQPELEPYKEVIDIMSARIKRAEQHNTYLREAVAECQRRVERLNEEIENVAWTSSPGLAQAQIDQLARDKARFGLAAYSPARIRPRADSLP